MTEQSTSKLPPWPTFLWAKREAKYYLMAALLSGGGFVVVSGIIYSQSWTIFAVGALMGALAAGALSQVGLWGLVAWRSGSENLNDRSSILSAKLAQVEAKLDQLAAETPALEAEIAALRRRLESESAAKQALAVGDSFTNGPLSPRVA